MKYLVSLLLILAFTFMNAQIGEKNFIDQNYIEVTGKAEIDVVPNEIYLDIVIDETDFSKKQSVLDLEAKMIAKLKEMKIDVAKNLTIRDMESNFQHYWLRNSTIRNRKEYQLLVYSASEGGSVFKALEKIGISRVSLDRLEHSDIEKLRSDIMIKAIKAAKKKASAMTSGIGQKIGKAIFIQELGNIYMSPNYSNVRMRRKAITVSSGQDEDNMEFKNIKLEYSVLARFKLIE